MKFVLPFLACLLPAVIGSTDVEHRQLQSVAPPTAFPGGLTNLEQEWWVSDPFLEYEPLGNVFTLETNFGNGNPLTYYSLEFFDKCPNGDPMYNDADIIVHLPTAVAYWTLPASLLGSFQQLGLVPFTEILTTSPRLLGSKFSFNILPGIANLPAIYSEVNGVGTAEFCVRVGSWDYSKTDKTLGIPYPVPILLPPTLINFKQMVVTVVYTLTDGFEVESFSTQVVESTTDLTEDTFESVATLCDDVDPLRNDPPFNPGDEVCIQVCPAEAGLVEVEEINWLHMDVQIPGSSSYVTMKVIDADPTVDQLNTVLDAECDVDACCRVKFLLNADFFPVGLDNEIVDPDELEILQTASVSATGSCTMAVGRRNLRLGHLGGDRVLQESQASEFDTTFEVNRRQSLESDGESFFTTVTVAAAAAVAGAALLV